MPTVLSDLPRFEFLLIDLHPAQQLTQLKVRTLKRRPEDLYVYKREDDGLLYMSLLLLMPDNAMTLLQQISHL